MSIPTEAIEAAAIAVFYQQAGLKPPYPLWDGADADEKDNCLNDAELALTSAAPHIRAAALRDAAGEADYRAEASHKVSQNRAAHDFPTRVRYAAYAEEARCMAHLLRARADQLEGKTK